MEFRDLKQQYNILRAEIDMAVNKVFSNTDFISGKEVSELEQQLADYVGVKHCISCANGTDALLLALMVWGIKPGDAVFVPDFTFFASAEVIAATGATPVFVDVMEETFNISPESLTDAIENVLREGKWKPRAIIAVDLFGLPADYEKIRTIAQTYHLLLLEDAAQGFGGMIGGKKACSFGDIGTTSFFPAKPLGCYGDGGAVFTDNDEWAACIRSLCVHGKGKDKYDNIRIGMNSRLDTVQAAILKVKLKAFREYELERVNAAAKQYEELLGKTGCRVPAVPNDFCSGWAQYTVVLQSEELRDRMQIRLKEKEIPSLVYYKKGMHEQEVFREVRQYTGLVQTENLCKTVLSLPMHPYLKREEQERISEVFRKELC